MYVYVDMVKCFHQACWRRSVCRMLQRSQVLKMQPRENLQMEKRRDIILLQLAFGTLELTHLLD